MKSLKFWRSLTLTGAIYGFAGWVYIVLNSEFHPYTLQWRLTHFANWPHEDTFGELCFLVSIVCFFAYQLLQEKQKSSS